MNTRAAMNLFLEFPAHPNNISKVELFVRNIAQEVQLSSDLYADILVTLTEAVNNAILHGNKSNIAKYVRVSARHNAAMLTLVVTDEGEGFDSQAIADPTSPENVVKTGGRGVFLIQNICHKVAYLNNGTTVEMRFNLAQ